MSPDTAFQVFSTLAMLGWLPLFFAPRWRPGTDLVAGAVVPGLIGAGYVFLMITGPQVEGGGFDSLDGVVALFSVPEVVLVGWLHYLAFDLFIGAWEVRDAQRHEISHLLVVPCLFLTFMAGPTGLLLYLILRAALRRRVDVDETMSVQPAT
jgi:hypothetical protein